MKEFGNLENTGLTDTNAVFLERLSLLIIMVRASLQGYPQGLLRRAAVRENAQFLHRACQCVDINLADSPGGIHLFRERVRLLCVMASAMVYDEYPLGLHRRKAISENICSIMKSVFPGQSFPLCHDILAAA